MLLAWQCVTVLDIPSNNLAHILAANLSLGQDDSSTIAAENDNRLDAVR